LVQGLGFLNSKAFLGLPEKFDSVSLILSKLKVLAQKEKKFLQLASLIERKI